jgi:hypothetical protein
MVAFRGHFDGRVIVPSDPILLPRDRELVFQVEAEGLRLGEASELRKLAGTLDEQSAREMEEAIRSECERVDDE